MSEVAKVEIIRTTGAREIHVLSGGPGALLQKIRQLIGAECTDSVNLRDDTGRLTGFVMVVDDNGYETETIQRPDRIELKPVRAKKPVNDEATRRYLAQCKPGTTHQIVGDVAIAWDEDFA